jgi:complex iron-sulfur molybdoenzyme family reductase subunit gamma
MALLAALAFSPAQAEDGVSFISVKQTNVEPPIDPLDPAWGALAPTQITLYPQASLIPASGSDKALNAAVRSIYNGKTLALHIEWPDATRSATRGIGKFADSIAVQWPLRYGPGISLPYVGMGHKDAAATQWLWRADGSVETLAAEGFGTLTTQAPDGVLAKGAWRDGKWQVVFMRSLLPLASGQAVRFDPAKQGVAPVALALWDGDAQERNGKKHLSAWQVFRFENAPANAAYLKTFSTTANGNAENGKRLMTEKGCAACHSFPGNVAQPTIGPNLAYVGGIHHLDYLLESITKPSKIVVPGKNYSMMQSGKLVSLMPPLQGAAQEQRDIAAFLQTLR